MATRRHFLVSAATLAAARAFALPFRRPKLKAIPIYTIYIGGDTARDAKGIYRASFNANTGRFSNVALAVPTARPSFLALGPSSTRRMLYAVNAVPDASASVTSFAIDPRTGDLQERGRVSAGSAGPAYISVDSSGHAAFVANYVGGTVSSYRVQTDGTLAGPAEQIDFKDEQRFGRNGPNSARQDGPHPHATTLSPDNRFLVVSELGHDAISVFEVDPDRAHLSTTEPHLFLTRPGSGPRHMVFHPNGRWVYSINELDSTIDHFLWTATHGQHSQALLVVAGSPVRTIAEDFPAEKNTAAEIAISPNGYTLYASNRGEDSLVVFAIDQATGELKLTQRIACGGRGPRQFALDPTGQWLICGNQDSGNLTVFRRDGSTGQLSGPVQNLPIPAPMFVLFT